MTSIPVIAIDGTAASGKGTLARRLAAYLDYAYLDTGLLYRAVAWSLIVRNRPADDKEAAIAAARDLEPGALDNPELRGTAAGRGASVVAAFPEVRQALFEFQREFPGRSGKAGAILDGRDIGTVIFPEARIKFFIDADQKVRAERRFKELAAKGEDVTFESVLSDMQTRDARDAGRKDAPMIMTEDAVLIDTTEADADTAFSLAFTWIPQHEPHLVAKVLFQYLDEWRDPLTSPQDLADRIVSTTPALPPGDVWTLLEHTYLPLPQDFVDSMKDPEDPLSLRLGGITKALREKLMEHCRAIALPDREELSDRFAAHPGDPERHGSDGVFDEEIQVWSAIMPCQQAALLNPRLPRFWFQYARVLFAAKRWEEGINHLLYAADMEHGGALAYLADFALDDSMGLGLDPLVAKALYEKAGQARFWMAEKRGEQIEEVSPDALGYTWDLGLHQDIHYHRINILIQLSNGFPVTESALPPEYLIFYVIGSLAGIRTVHVWMVDPEIIPDRVRIEGTMEFEPGPGIGTTIARAASSVLPFEEKESFIERLIGKEFYPYFDQGYEDGIAFAKAEGPESGQLEFYIQTVMAIYFGSDEGKPKSMN